MNLPTLGRTLTEQEQTFLLDLIICLNKARTQFPGNQNRLAALVEETGEVARALQENQGRGRVYSECVDVGVTAMRLALEGDADYPKPVRGVRVGFLQLQNLGNGKIWIGEVNGGEGGEFPMVDVAQLIQKYYGEHF